MKSLAVFLFLTVWTTGISQNKIGPELFDDLRDDAIILSEAGILRGQKEIKGFIDKFTQANNGSGKYSNTFNVEVNKLLDFEIGTIETDGGSFSVMFLKRTDDPAAPKIEFLVIFESKERPDVSELLNVQRARWMELCNAHQAGELVKEVYSRDAYYYNRGRLLQGTKAIAAEYGYMNSPAYSLKLTPLHVEFVSDEIAYEIGRCSGSYPLPYMLLWQRQENGDWQVLMDSNY